MKLLDTCPPVGRLTSHPSRGAWVEIKRLLTELQAETVAPLTGCVG